MQNLTRMNVGQSSAIYRRIRDDTVLKLSPKFLRIEYPTKFDSNYYFNRPLFKEMRQRKSSSFCEFIQFNLFHAIYHSIKYPISGSKINLVA